MNQEGSRRSGVPSPANETPGRKGITPTQKDLGPESAFCTCGHDITTHRHARCWTGWDGNPVHRTKTAIACPCTGWEPTP